MQFSPGDAETAPLFVVNGADQPTAVGLTAMGMWWDAVMIAGWRFNF